MIKKASFNRNFWKRFICGFSLGLLYYILSVVLVYVGMNTMDSLFDWYRLTTPQDTLGVLIGFGFVAIIGTYTALPILTLITALVSGFFGIKKAAAIFGCILLLTVIGIVSFMHY